MFTEKGVIPFGLEALVDRPAFIHHNPPPPPLSLVRAHHERNGQLVERGKKCGMENGRREEFSKIKIAFISPHPLFLPSSIHRENRHTTCPSLSLFLPPRTSFEPIDVYFLTKAAGNGAFVPPTPRGGGGGGRMHFVRRSWKISDDYRVLLLLSPSPYPPFGLGVREKRAKAKRSAFFSKGSFVASPL